MIIDKGATLGIIASVLAILDMLCKYIPDIKLGYITKPILYINLLELTILFFLIVIVYNFMPSVFAKNRNRRRAKRFYNNWVEFKNVLQKFSQTGDESLQKEYYDLKKILELDFNYFSQKIKEIGDSSHRGSNDISLWNFERTFSPRLLKEWRAKINRQLPDQLDCFDYIPLSPRILRALISTDKC